MGLFCRLSDKVKNMCFFINLLLITMTIPMPYILSLISPNNLKAIFGVPFFHIPVFTAIMVKETGKGMGIWFFVMFVAVVLLVLCGAVLARLKNKNFSLIVICIIVIDMLLTIYYVNFISALWRIAIITLTIITRKETII